MALALLLTSVWLLTKAAVAQEPPGNLPFQLPLPLIHQKLQQDSYTGAWNILTSIKGGLNAHVTDDPSPLSQVTVTSVNGTTLPSYDTVYTFDQLIDHNDTKLGTFSQRYYFTYEFYEPGGPIFFSVPSESSLENFDGSVTNSSLTGYLAQQNRGAAVVLEHRFFGLSNPYPNLTEASLAYLTVEQAIGDIAYFALNAKLPMPNGAKVGPYNAPWVLVGGSYPGALVAWTTSTHPNLFAAGWASSAVVQATDYFWNYWDVINQFMPSNCSSDVRAVISYLDQTFTSSPPAAQKDAQTAFGLQNLAFADDMMAAIRAPLFSWQDLQPFYQDTNAGFYVFCNYLEYDRSKGQYETSGNGVGLDTALSAYGNWTKYEIRVAGCSGYEETCYGTHSLNASATYTNTTVNNAYRSWAWLYCNQLGFFFSGSPANWPTITSRLTTPDTEARMCSLYFPEKFPMGVTANQTHNITTFNSRYGGWNLNTTNVFFSNGKKDPWRGATLSSDLLTPISSASQPVAVADGGFHCSDLVMQSARDPSIQAVQNLGSSYINKWLSDWYSSKSNITRPANTTSFPDPTTLPPIIFSPKSIPASVVTATVQQYPALTPISAIAIPTAASSPAASPSPTGAGKSAAWSVWGGPVDLGFSSLWILPALYWTFG